MVSPARLVAAFLAAVAVSGCARPTRPPPSAFFSGIDGIKIKAIAEQCAPAAVEKWGNHGSGGTSGQKYFFGDFQCEPETLDAYLLALKAELQKVVERHGARVTSSLTLNQDETEKAFAAKIAVHRQPPAVPLTAFQLDYEIGAAHGEILVTVGRLESTEQYEYPLWLAICVIGPTPAGQQPVVVPKTGTGPQEKPVVEHVPV